MFSFFPAHISSPGRGANPKSARGLIGRCTYTFWNWLLSEFDTCCGLLEGYVSPSLENKLRVGFIERMWFGRSSVFYVTP